MKFLVAYVNKGKFLVKMEFEVGKEKWATTSEEIVNYAKANLKANEDVDVVFSENNGQYSVSSLVKKGSTPAPVETKTEAPKAGEYKCEDCGKVLKDGKYKKCFDCNKKNPAKPKEDSKPTEYKCTDCGKALKDGKYTKCFPCNKKNPEPKKEYSGGKRDAVGQSIEKQAMMKASAMAVGSAFVGVIGDAGTLADMIIVVYEKLLKKLTE